MNESQLSFIKVNDNKAGMKNLDKDKINAIILEASKGSRFYENEVKKEKLLKIQIESLLRRYKLLTEDDILLGENKADVLIEDINLNMNLCPLLIHVDMDAFFAAVEIKDDSSLRKKPMAVGSLSMLSTSNYEARKYGVRAGMPGFIAKKLCPDLILIEPNFEKYSRINRLFREIFTEYDANFVGCTLDEAYLDITNHLKNRYFYTPEQLTYACKESCGCKEPNSVNRKHPASFSVCGECGKLIGSLSKKFSITAWGAVEELRFRIFCRTGLTCSAGIACNALLAKIASDLNKPNGQHQILSTVEDIQSFIRHLPIRKVPGFGKITEQKLAALGITNCGDIFGKRGALYHLFKTATFSYFMRVSLGCGDEITEVVEEEENSTGPDRKSVSVERTFADCDNEVILLDKCKMLCNDLCEDLGRHNIMGKCISIKLKLTTFEVRTRAVTIKEYTNDVDIIMKHACELLVVEINNYQPYKLSLRLLGVRMSSLISSTLAVHDGQVNILDAFKQQERFSQPVNVKQHSDKIVDSLLWENETEDVKISKVICPVCKMDVHLVSINNHLDICLSCQSPDSPSTSSHQSQSVMSANSLVNSQNRKRTAATFPKVAHKKIDEFFVRNMKENENETN